MKPYYNLSLRPGASNVCAITGKFTTRADSYEVIIGQGEMLSLLSPDPSGEIYELCSISFATSIRSITHFGSTPEEHVILVGLDTGGFLSVQITTDAYFEIKHRVHFDNPVQFLVADHQGRTIFVVPRNQNKFFYIAHDVVGPPTRIEMPGSNTITYAVVALSGHDDEKNLCFAAIEDNDGKRHIAYYETRNLQIVRSTVLIDGEANLLLAVPGGVNGPGGILVITNHMVIYMKRDFLDISSSFPGKNGRPPDNGTPVVSATHCHLHEKYGLLYLLQKEFGDIFRVSLIFGDTGVTGLDIEHFDTIPVTYAMCFLHSGILFAASKTGNHALYQLSEASANLLSIDDSERIIGMEVIKLPEEKTPFIVSLRSRGQDFSLCKLWPGIKISKMAEAMLHTRPNALWRVKKDANIAFTESIAVSYANETLFMDMSLEGETQVILKDHRFEKVEKPSLAVTILGNGSMLQVHRKGIVHVTKNRECTNIRHMKEEIVKVAYNRFQVVVALRGGNLIYYTVRADHGYDKLKMRGRCQINAEVACLCIPQVPEGKKCSFCLAVGLADGRIMILVLHPLEQLFEVLSVQTMLSPPESLLFLPPLEGNEPPYHFLIAGLEHGLLSTMVMVSSGRIWFLCSQYLGSRKLELFSAIVRGQQVIICLSDRPWIGHVYGQKFWLTPLSCEALDSAASICCHRPEGVAAITGDRLKLLTIEYLGDNFSEKTFNPDHTPKKFLLHPEQELIIVISNEQVKLFQDQEEEGDEEGWWVSHIMILDPRSGETVSSLELQDFEIAHNVCTVDFDNNGEYKTLLAVAIGIQESPIGFIHIYRLSEEGKSLAVLRSTHVEGVPLALSQFRGALLAGIGPVLRMYDLGEDQLHMRCESRIFPETCVIISINVVGNRIYVEDNTQIIHCFKYRTAKNELYVFQYGNIPSSNTAFLPIDSSNLAWADKFGNVFFVKIPQEASNEGSEDPSSSKSGGGKPYGSVNEVEEMCFQVGDVVTCLQNACLVPGGDECVIYGTVRGTLGALLPLAIEDAEFLSGLEKQIRQECRPLCSRSRPEHKFSQNCVIDGDICEKFQTLDPCSQRSIAGKLGTTEIEILRKLFSS